MTRGTHLCDLVLPSTRFLLVLAVHFQQVCLALLLRHALQIRLSPFPVAVLILSMREQLLLRIVFPSAIRAWEFRCDMWGIRLCSMWGIRLILLPRRSSWLHPVGHSTTESGPVRAALGERVQCQHSQHNSSNKSISIYGKSCPKRPKGTCVYSAMQE